MLKACTLKVMFIAMLCNSLAWTWHGDYEALINGHEIHAEQHDYDEKLSLEHEDDHHCSFSAHVLIGFAQECRQVKNDTHQKQAFEYFLAYSPPVPEHPKRPPIA